MVSIVPAQPGGLAAASLLQASIAGAESNVAVHLARRGRRVEWMGLVGTDPFGERILTTLRAQGVHTTHAHTVLSAPTGIMFKEPVGDGRAVYYYRSGSAGALLTSGDVAHLASSRSRAIHLTGVTAALSESCRGALETLLSNDRERSGFTSFDVNHRPALWASEAQAAQTLHALASQADLVFVGLDEAELLWGCTVPEDVRLTLGAPGTLVVKNGAVGATAFTRRCDGTDSVTFSPSALVDVVDAVGAGDAFAAGYLDARLEGLDVAACLQAGHVIAASVLGSLLDTPEVGR